MCRAIKIKSFVPYNPRNPAVNMNQVYLSIQNGISMSVSCEAILASNRIRRKEQCDIKPGSVRWYSYINCTLNYLLSK